MRRQINRLAVLAQLYASRIANIHLERRVSFNDIFASGRLGLAEYFDTIAICDTHPALLGKDHAQPAFCRYRHRYRSWVIK
jgi:hypothetical protein